MSKLVFITQRLDPEHPDLGATVALVRELAALVDEVAVLALSGESAALPANAHLHTFGAGSRYMRGLRFLRVLSRELRRPRPQAVVAHMIPIYAVLAAPLARPLGVRVVLWFTHWRRSVLLRTAALASTDIVSVAASSFPLRSRKVRPIGHGIDVNEFPCVDRSEHKRPLRVVSLGRTSPAKGLATIVEGVRLARARGVELELELRGPSLTEEEQRHRAELGDVQPPVPRPEMPALLGRADVLVNNMKAGAPDKIVYEACATCLPVLASNPSLFDLLDEELRFDRDSPAQLADRLQWVAGLTVDERSAIGRELRSRVERSHSTQTWAQGIVAVAQGTLART